MIKDRAKEILIKMGMPVSVLGFKYIPDVMEYFEAGYENAKITALYVDVAKKYNSSGSRVERAIRHAFEGVVENGPRDLVNKYLSYENTTNSNLLKLLYYRLKQEENETNNTESPEIRSFKTINSPNPYQILEDDMIMAVQKFIKNLREVSTDACSKVG
ncbi:sporulation initiation factor Spo0A C-terminal domain-containing protein [Lacrimispora sp.]|uniref:sporulation initiation factor Spo0A C-terminal domain-containing protein n=1 Tax=Lacrimispora sp. TaxID=2719234 RepID=UPI003460EC7E